MAAGFKQIMTDLKKKIYKPIYLLMGEESYYIDQITNYILENVLKPEEKGFNQSVLYGKDVDASIVDNAARRYPMMANHQVIVVKEAQNMKKIEDLSYYASSPLKSTILVLNYKYKTVDKRKKLIKEIKKNGVVFESKKLYDNQVPSWISNYLSEKKFSIDPKASMILSEFLGSNLSKIANELDKLIISLPAGTQINASHIEKNIGISKDYNNFELQKALGEKDVLKANRIINHFGKNPKDNPMIVTIVVLFNFFSKVLIYHFLTDKSQKNVASVLKVHPFFVRDYETAARRFNPRKTVATISLLREYDLRSKGVGNVSTPPGDLLKELVFKILHQ